MLCFRVSVDHQKALYLEERELFEEVRNMSFTGWLTSRENLQTQTPLKALYMAMIYSMKK
jgi:hypothetical protein